MATHFIADLHLQPGRPELTAIFHRYLAGPARAADALYILGDLFEYWIGDDGSLIQYQASVSALAELSSYSVPIFFMRGNRDFAVGPEFAKACGLRILDDPLRIDLYGTPTLISHGDCLCTDDRRHQAFRRKYTNPRWRQRMLKLPRFMRRRIAEYARAKSQANTQRMAMDIMDVNQAAVADLMCEYGARRLIHSFATPRVRVCKRWINALLETPFLRR